MICHPESEKSRADKYHSMSDEIHLEVGVIGARNYNYIYSIGCFIFLQIFQFL